MESIDKERLDYAIEYLNRIAYGRNPINNKPAEEDDVLNNPNVVRCMFFVKEVLEEVRRNGYTIGKMKKNTAKENYPLEVLDEFRYISDKPISKFTEQLNEYVDVNNYKKISYTQITNWLVTNNYLTEQYIEETNQKTKLPTEKGIELGIRAERRTKNNGQVYWVVIYGETAQKFIVENMMYIL